MGKWRPIETAPKDESSILVYARHGFYVAFWFEGWLAVDDNKHGPYPLRGPSPTHWMPLPAPPEEAIRGKRTVEEARRG